MANKLNLGQAYEPKSFAGQIGDNFFGQIWEKKPKLATQITRRLMTRNVPSYAGYLSGFSTLKIGAHDERIVWKMIGSNLKNVPLVEARVGASTVTSASANVGIGGSKFTLVFKERYFNEGEILVGEYNEVYRMQVVGEPMAEGSNFAYTVVAFGESRTHGIPASNLVGGKKFSYEYAPVELEEHDDVGGLRFNTALELSNEVSAIRKSYAVAGREFNRTMMTPVKVVTADNKPMTFNMSMPWVEWIFEQEFEQEFDRLLIYGRSNRDETGNYHDRGKSGNLIKQGDGLRAQKSVGHTLVYDTFSIKYIEDALYQISAGRLDMKDRLFVMRTGERGAIQFHNAASALLNSWVPLGTYGQYAGNNVALTRSTSSAMHDNSVSIGAQIVEYRGPNGLILRVEVDSSYDDMHRNKIMRNNNEWEGPAESYRYDIDYIGTPEEPNIQLVQVEGFEEGMRGYHGGPQGFNNPFLGKGAGLGANGIDKYTKTIFKRGGVIVYDPQRTMTIVPQDLAAFV